MKKNIFIMAAMAAAFISCEMEPANPETPIESVPEGYVEVKFSGICTKTTATENGTVSWEANDVVSIYYLDSENKPKSVTAKAESAGASTTFTAFVPQEDTPDHYWAAYPEGAGSLEYTDGKETFKIAVGKGDGTFKKANYMAAYTTTDAMSLAFRNAVSVIRLELPEDGVITIGGKEVTINSVSVAGSGTQVISRGTAEVIVENGVVTEYGEPAAAEESYAYTTVGAEAIADGKVYIPTFPGTFTEGVVVRYNGQKDLVPGVMSKVQAVSVERGHIFPLSDLSSKIVTDWYVSPTGEGDGKSAGNAMSLADAQAKFSATDKASGCWHMNGTTFHLDGTFKLENTIKFPAGAELYKTDITGASPATTILDGNNACRVLWLSDNMLVGIRNLTIQNGSNGAGAGIDLVLTAAATDDNFILDCENCIITSCSNPDSGSGALYASAESIGGFARFNNCSFEGNSAKGSGVLLTAGKVFFMFNNCSFTGNSGVGAGGHIIYMNGATTCRLGMNNCTLLHNDTDKTKNEGVIAARGYTVIANSTIIMDPSNPLNGTNWGCIGLLPAESGSGLAINSVFNGTNAIRGLNASAMHKWCVYTDVLGNTGISESYNATDFNNYTQNISTVNGVSQTYYTWDEDFTGQGDFPAAYLTAAEIEAEIKKVPSIGTAFAEWVKSVGGFSEDILGTDREADGYIYPGNCQQ